MEIERSKAIKFRQWATSVLKNYIQNGYVVNSEKITHERFKELENEVLLLKSKVEYISNSFEDNSILVKSHFSINVKLSFEYKR